MNGVSQDKENGVFRSQHFIISTQAKLSSRRKQSDILSRSSKKRVQTHGSQTTPPIKFGSLLNTVSTTSAAAPIPWTFGSTAEHPGP